MSKLEVIKKELAYPCYCCRKSIRGKTVPRKGCKVCKSTGFFKDEIYYHVVKGIAFDGDTIK
jgi:hypothetical protein